MGFSLAAMIEAWRDTAPDASMVTADGVTTSWSENAAVIRRSASALADLGIGPGDRVGILARNCPEFITLLGAASLLSATLVPLNWRLSSPELAWIVDDSTAKIVIAGEEQLEGLPPAEHVAVVPLEKLRAAVRAAELWPGAPVEGADAALQVYTSGTTGRPKGALITNANLEALLSTGPHDLELGPRSVAAVAHPMFHIGGLGWMLRALAAGAHIVILPDVDPALVLKAIEEHGVTHIALVPSSMTMLLDHPDLAATDVSSLRYIGYGASPIGEALLERAMAAFGCGFLQLYGMTETAGGVTVLRAAEHTGGRRRLRSCGVPFGHVELKVVDSATGAPRPIGETGEVWVRSDQVMQGYWNNPAATASAITPDGWLRTGDVGYVDGDGFLYLRDRLTDMIVSGGENVYPAEVESVLSAHPDVSEAAVIGVPSDRWGESVRAVVVSRNGELTEDALIAFARRSLAGYKCPKSVEFVAEVPKNSSGKVLRRVLREPHWAGSERRVH